MKIIRELIDNMEQELDLAKLYAQNFLIYMADGEEEYSEMFKRMAKESLQHVEYMRDFSETVFEKLHKSYTPPEAMIRVWEKKNAMYIDVAKWLKDMLE